MTEVYCPKCAENVEEVLGEIECLAIGCIGMRVCTICRVDINCNLQDYYAFRDGTFTKYRKVLELKGRE